MTVRVRPAVSPAGRLIASTRCRRITPCLPSGGIAQLVEHMTENHGVPGSNPGPATSKSPANSGKMEITRILHLELWQQCGSSSRINYSLWLSRCFLRGAVIAALTQHLLDFRFPI